MAEILLPDVDDRTLAVLKRKAERRGVSISEIAREWLEAISKLSPGLATPDELVITEEDRAMRRRTAAEMAELRARTLKPFSADSTLLIREMRDTR